MGPTAAGKTAVALALYKRLPIDLISVDSALVYRDMNIGTAKPTPEILAEAPHALIDIREPTETYSVAQFCEDAKREIAKSMAQGRIPLLVGGTMLYFSSLINGLNDLPTSNDEVRQKVSDEAQQLGWSVMHQRLAAIDPEGAARIHPNDPQRIGRALEVYEMTGRSLTDWWTTTEKEVFPWRTVSIAVSPTSRQLLQDRIAQRFLIMLQEGFIAEVEQLRKHVEMHAELPSMRAVGYRQVWHYLEKQYDYDAMVNKGIIATRQLAKRQLTWLRRWDNLNWFDSGITEVELIEQVYTLINQTVIEER